MPIDRALRDRLALLRRRAELAELTPEAVHLASPSETVRVTPLSEYMTERRRLSQGDLRDQVATLSSQHPFVLLPLRLETRFLPYDGKPHLFVRVIPDGLAVDTHEPGLTDREADLGAQYWREAADAGRPSRSAFERIFATTPPLRAAHVVKRTAPTESAAPRRGASWSRAPLARVLPERLAFYVGKRSQPGSPIVFGEPHVGKLVPDPLPVGLTPTEDGLTRGGDGGVVVPPPVRWLVDFEAAVACGMGIRIPLSTGEAQGIDALVVVGARVGSSEQESAKLLERLFEAQRYTVGLDVVRQGTPTNVLSDDRDDQPPRALDHGTVFDRELQDRPVDAGTDAQRLARALALRGEVFSACAQTHEARNATSMNHALWPATLGYFFDQMMDGAVPKDVLEDLRHVFTAHVTGRGPLPCIRVGDQPYGLVLASADLPSGALAPTGAVEPPGEPRISKIEARVEQVRRDFARLAAKVAPLARDGVTPERVVDLLSLLPRSASVFRRYLLGHGYMTERSIFLTSVAGGKAWEEARRRESIALLRELGFEDDAAPYIAVLTHAGFSEETGLSLVTEGPASETEPLPPLLPDGRNYLAWLATASLAEVQSHPSGVTAPKTLLYRLVRHARIRASLDSAAAVIERTGGPKASAFHDRDQLTRGAKAPRPLDALGAVGHLGQTRVDLRSTVAEAIRAGEVPNAEDALVDAILGLADLPTAELERLLVEHLDCCSHRLDAWVVGLTARRMWRAHDAIDDLTHRHVEVGKGIHLGAFGIVHDLTPASHPRQAEGGFLHGPSLAHATAGAILRSAHLGAGADAGGAFAVNLSSARIRRALELFDGVGTGQSLGALLGYRIERSLHDAPGGPFDLAIGPLRRLAPLSAASTDPSSETPSAAAHDVVDGLALVTLVRGKAFPYGSAELGQVPPAHQAAVQDALKSAEADLDACGDLALAEAVFQNVRGNPTRGTAALRAMSEGHGFPSPEVVAAPRPARAMLHRLGLVLPLASAPTNAGPRARLAPGIDRFLGGLLGDLENISCHVSASGVSKRVTLASLGVGALDCLIFARRHPSADAELRDRVRLSAGPVPGGKADWSIALDDPGPGPASTSIDDARTLIDALDELLQRARTARASDVGAAPGSDPDDATVSAQLGALRAELAAARGDLAGTEVARGLRTAARHLIPGAAAAAAMSSPGGTTAAGEVLREVSRRLTAFDGEMARPKPDLLEAARALLGPAAFVEPRLKSATALEAGRAAGTRTVGPKQLGVDRYLEGLGRVRPAVGAYLEAVALATLLGAAPPPITHVRVPSARRAATDMPVVEPGDDGVSLLLAIQSETALNAAVLVIDEWTDLLPSTEVTTGVAFHANRPDAQAPQAILVGVPRVATSHWTLDALRGLVMEAFDLAKLRAVSPYELADTAYAHLLPAVVAPVAVMGGGRARSATLSLADEARGGKLVRHA